MTFVVALTQGHLAGACITLLLFLFLGVYSGKHVKNAVDFDTGGKSAGSVMVAGMIMGTIVGGSSTVGTAELAFHWGLSAWWFTLGSAFGALLLAGIFDRPMRQSGQQTIQAVISKEFGSVSGVVTSVLTSIGIMLNIVAQILAANALLGTIFGLPPFLCAATAVIIMICYVAFGGIRGTGVLGIVKLVLLYTAVLISGTLAVLRSGGLGHIYQVLPHEQYFNLFARGLQVDLGAGLSVAFGVVSTQTYIQALLAGKSDRAARNGALWSAVLIPPIGLGSILIGYYMRLQYPDIVAAQALPLFVLNHLPPVFSGVVLATLLIAVVGTGSGMALGFSTIVSHDLYKRFFNPQCDGQQLLRVSRIVIVASLVVSAVFTVRNLHKAILTWGFLSMGLRAAVLLVPLCFALFHPGHVRARYAIASSIAGIGSMIIAELLAWPVDSLILGLATGLLLMIWGDFAH